jgi:hypothetical protein
MLLSAAIVRLVSRERTPPPDNAPTDAVQMTARRLLLITSWSYGTNSHRRPLVFLGWHARRAWKKLLIVVDSPPTTAKMLTLPHSLQRVG